MIAWTEWVMERWDVLVRVFKISLMQSELDSIVYEFLVTLCYMFRL